MKELQAHELRIGNWVYDGDEPVQMVCIMEDNIERLNPIHITEEWLGKFGGEESKAWDGAVLKIKKGLKLQVRFYKEKWIAILKYGEYVHQGFYLPFDGYVHQLQNLYFALTGTELEIKE